METSAAIDPRMLAAQALFAQDGSVVDVVASIDMRAVSTRDVVVDLCGGVLVVGLLRNDLADPALAYKRWLKQLRASAGTSRQTLRIEWDPGCDTELR